MRYLAPHIEADLNTKMVFLGGPRQCGKTTLAEAIARGYPTSRTLNWDLGEHKREILKKTWSDSDKLLVFDELHKFPKWKNWIKGVYDTQKGRHHFLVTGSARLDVYRTGGDSLLGRYHYWRLHPFSLCEHPQAISTAQALERLLKYGGFPEPFLKADEVEARRWRRERFERVLRDDVRDLEHVRDIQTLQLFVELLRQRVGTEIVLSNMSEDLQVSQKTLSHWLEVLSRMYLIFIVRPYTRKLPRAIQKAPKVYFFDNADVIGDESVRFENLVATHLLKQLQFVEDSQGYRCSLFFVRDKEKREVDFLIEVEGRVTWLVEAKSTETEFSNALKYYHEKLKPTRTLQILRTPCRPFARDKMELVNVIEAFSGFKYDKGSNPFG